MRLNEFTDPEEYTPPATDAEDFQQQLLFIWHDWSADELAPSVLGSGNQQPIKRMNRFDALSVGRHVGGAQPRSRRGTS
jgi:hypothetical protein